ncbi:hypothetical protein [Mycetohabitans rhizoxinica]|uniref:F-box domain-containing protein n=1 Tax=Mycetohabitans rhizoxinica TaxID=412963 RepID=A0ABZ2Q073_9BURK
MEFDLNIITLNGTQAAIYSTESQKSGCPAAAPPLPPGSTVPSQQQSSSEKIEQFVAKFNRVSIESAPQAEVVQKLAEQIEGLPADRQAEKFKELFKIAGRVPKQGLEIQQGMIRSIDKLTSMQRRPLYDFVYDDARRRSIAQGSTWAAVASLLSADIPDPSLQEDSDGKRQRKWKRTQFKSIKDAALGDIKSVVSELNWTDRADVITELAKVPPNFHYSRTKAHNYNRPAMEKRYKELEEYMQSLPLRDRVNPAKYLEKATKYLSGNKRPDRLEKLEYLKTPYNRLPAELVSLIAEFLSIEDFDKFQEINKNQNRQRSDFLLREKQLKKLDKIFPLLERVFQVERFEIKKGCEKAPV